MNMNHIKSVLLLGLLTFILLSIGNLIGGSYGIQIALFMALLFNGIAYFFSEKIVLSMYRAQPLDQYKYKEIFQAVHDLSAIMELPMPKLWIIESPIANAFATGRNPHNASIALTRGILEILEPDELRGVLAHELGHVKNRDILITSIAAIIAGAIGYLAYTLRNAAWWGSFSDRRNNNQSNPIVLIILSILIPFIATLIQLALSRSREYLADYTGSCATKSPLSLAHALQKLEHHAQYKQTAENTPPYYASMSALFIVHPYKCSSYDFKNWFASHPPMHKRIEELENLHKKLFSYYARR
jgi:heat shock protein HtpX